MRFTIARENLGGGKTFLLPHGWLYFARLRSTLGLVLSSVSFSLHLGRVQRFFFFFLLGGGGSTFWLRIIFISDLTGLLKAHSSEYHSFFCDIYTLVYFFFNAFHGRVLTRPADRASGGHFKNPRVFGSGLEILEKSHGLSRVGSEGFQYITGRVKSP